MVPQRAYDYDDEDEYFEYLRKEKNVANKGNIKQNKNIKPKQTVQKKKKKKNIVKKDAHHNVKVKQVICVLAFFALIVTISYRYSLINESFANMQVLKRELTEAQKQNELLKLGIENSINLSNIEKIARERLGMQKISNEQKVYVSLDKEDYTEVSEEMQQKQENIFMKIINEIRKFLD